MQKRYRTAENIIFDTIVYIVMIFVLIVCLVPFLYMIAVSFSGMKPLVNNEVFLWPKDFTLESYKTIFTYPNFFHAYGNTFIYAFGGTAIALVMTSLFAYPLSKSFLWGNKLITKMVVLTMFFSGGMIPTYLVYSSLGIVGTRAAILMPFAINSFNLIILINFRTSGRFPSPSRRRRSSTALGISAFCGVSSCRFPRRALPPSACTTRCFSGTTGSMRSSI